LWFFPSDASALIGDGPDGLVAPGLELGSEQDFLGFEIATHFEDFGHAIKIVELSTDKLSALQIVRTRFIERIDVVAVVLTLFWWEGELVTPAIPCLPGFEESLAVVVVVHLGALVDDAQLGSRKPDGDGDFVTELGCGV
jgi:hypothetical protein